MSRGNISVLSSLKWHQIGMVFAEILSFPPRYSFRIAIIIVGPHESGRHIPSVTKFVFLNKIRNNDQNHELNLCKILQIDRTRDWVCGVGVHRIGRNNIGFVWPSIHFSLTEACFDIYQSFQNQRRTLRKAICPMYQTLIFKMIPEIEWTLEKAFSNMIHRKVMMVILTFEYPFVVSLFQCSFGPL